MKVLLFTSQRRSVIEDFNIWRLTGQVEADYSLVLVRNANWNIRVPLERRIRRAILRHGLGGLPRLALHKVFFGKARAKILDDYYGSRTRYLESALFHGRRQELAGAAVSRIPTREVDTVNGPDAEEALRAVDPDVILQCGAGILKANIIEIPRIGILNLHPGLTTKIRGIDSAFWGIYYGRPDWLGVTLHFIDEGIDTGPIIAQRNVPYQIGESVAEVLERSARAGAELLIENITAMKEGRKIPPAKSREKGIYRSGPSPEQVDLLLNNGYRPVERLEASS